MKTIQHLSRDHTASQPSDHTASQPLAGSISAVTIQHLSREATAQMPLKPDSQEINRCDFAGRITTQAEPQLVAPSARRESPTASVASKADQNQNQFASKTELYPMRPKGTIIPRPKPAVPAAEEQPKPSRPVGTITKGEKPLPPNRICYAEAFKDWRPGKAVPRCRRCDYLLHPNENHVCPGYTPKYPAKPTATMEERRYMRDDWDDDQYDRTTPAFVPKNPDEEDSGTVEHCEDMDEYEYLRLKFGTADMPDFEE
jgi:hypothetical protein